MHISEVQLALVCYLTKQDPEVNTLKRWELTANIRTLKGNSQNDVWDGKLQ
jgi:hypothetical protein